MKDQADSGLALPHSQYKATKYGKSGTDSNGVSTSSRMKKVLNFAFFFPTPPPNFLYIQKSRIRIRSKFLEFFNGALSSLQPQCLYKARLPDFTAHPLPSPTPNFRKHSRHAYDTMLHMVEMYLTPFLSHTPLPP